MISNARLKRLMLALALVPTGFALAADNITLSDLPLFVVSPVKPNLMVILDNSQSMDATMEGMIISGDAINTRGNIARKVLRDAISANRNKANFGLTTFGTSTPALRDIHAYYMGDANTMVFTNDCAAALEANTARKGCVEIPGTPVGGLRFVTYSQSGDDPAINDVFYNVAGTVPDVMYATSTGGSQYLIYGSRTNANQPWESAGFGNPRPYGTGSINFTATDAGFVANASATPSVTRQVFIKRPGFGYRGTITGVGNIRRIVQPSSLAHINALIGADGLLKNEAQATNTEIKNAALYTPLAGTLDTVRDYFDDNDDSPITHSCQKSFVILATDGVPTGRSDGTEYTLAERTNTKVGDVWNFGTAQQHVFNEITRLRTTVEVPGNDKGVLTYVIGVGQAGKDASSRAALDRMAELGGTGIASVGDSEANLTEAIKSAINNSLPRGGSSVALNSSALNAGSAVYQSKFVADDWSGSFQAFEFDADGAIKTDDAWNAGTILQARTAARHILTYKPSADLGLRGVPFRWPTSHPGAPGDTEMDLAQSNEIEKDAAGTDQNDGALRLAFLRGSSANEAQYRARPNGPLGDIVNSAPVFVGPPAFNYANDFESKPYGAFALANANRKKIVYVGANDGMLHAFDAANGEEVFAYVPAALVPKLSQLTSPNYSHRYYVDGTPTVGDVFYGASGGNWHTLLVAGMRAGAKGLFALDVTDPTKFTESTAASVVRWEFPNDADMGYVFGQPLIVKTNNGRWSVIVGGGYENTSGNAVLFIIDAEDGTFKKIDTGSGVNNGLSGPAAIDTNGDGIVDVVYAGDLNGNLWKFDLSSANKALWVVGNSGVPLYAAGATKPITSAPDVTRHPRGGYLIGFGTGRYIDENDNTNTSSQSIYAIWDKPLTSGTVTELQLQQQTILDTATNGGRTFRLVSHKVGTPVDTIVTGSDTPTVDREAYLTGKRGWFLNLNVPSGTGERVVADVAFRSGRLIAVSMIPGTSCDAADGSGWLMELDAITGNRLDVLTFDINRDGKLLPQVVGGDYLQFSVSGTAGNNVSGYKIDGIPSGQTTITKGGTLEDRLISTSKGELVQVGAGRGAGGVGRAMWREVR
jgi:type IV pilus assembly protein PilY1